MEQFASAYVGAFDRAGDDSAHQKGQEGSAARKHERIPKDFENAPIAIGIDEVLQRKPAWSETGILTESGIEQGRERHDNEPGADQGADPQSERRRPETRKKAPRLRYV